ncbi:MAG: F0F1 ATP synthase subunit A [Candidatus Kerfeldbacteria bacterium]|nr:F0F1 ATP synthase subunit A [Candidatus Kerfeldbacteria bacterium]
MSEIDHAVDTTVVETEAEVHATEEAYQEVHTETHEEESLIHVSLKPETLFNLGPIPVTNSLWVAYTISIALIVIFAIAARNLKAVPGKFQLFIETIITGLYNLIHSLTNNEKVTKSVYPVFLTTMLFLLCSNLFGQIPGLMALEWHTGGHEVHFFRPVTADYAAVIAITLFLFVYWQVTVVRFIGFKGFSGKFFNFSGVIPFGVGLLEIIGEFAKIISLSFRLFGNIFSEEVLIMVMLAIAPVLGPIPFSLLGLLTSVIQALLFPMLILLFMNMSIAEHAKGHH